MSKAKTIRKLDKVSADDALIALCMSYAKDCAGSVAVHLADPTGNSDYAAPVSERLRGRASKTLAGISDLRATTACGLRAKAFVAGLIAKDCTLFPPEDFEAGFLKTFARDVSDFARQILEATMKHETAVQS